MKLLQQRPEIIDSDFGQCLQKFLCTGEHELHAKETVALVQEEILAEIIRLSRTVRLPSSEVDDTVAEIFEQLGLHGDVVVDGYELPMPEDALKNLNAMDARALYSLTVIGQLENLLTGKIAQTLIDAFKDSDSLLDDWEEEHDVALNAQWGRYQEEMDEFEDGDYGHDYDGPIRPQMPELMPYDRQQAIRQRDALFTPENCDDIELLLEHINIEKGLTGDMLYNDFIGMEMMELIVEAINFRSIGLDKALAARILLNIDLQFPDIDVTKPGYLIEIFRFNLTHYFYRDYVEYASRASVEHVLKQIADDERVMGIIDEFNTSNSDLARQRCWASLSTVINLAVSLYQESESTRRTVLKNNIDTAKKNLLPANTLTSLIKVFPTDDADSLVYADEDGNMCFNTVRYPLRPVMKTLHAIAVATHSLLVDQKVKNIEKTNIVTAMLTFVVDADDNQGQLCQRDFFHVPLTLDYSAILLSRDTTDGVFKDKHDYETSIGSDRHIASTVIDGTASQIPASRAWEAIQLTRRLISTLNLSQEKHTEVMQMLDAAEIAQPLAVGVCQQTCRLNS